MTLCNDDQDRSTLQNKCNIIKFIYKSKYFTEHSNARTNQSDAIDRERRIELITRVPLHLEPVLSLGFLQCLTVFFSLFTITPIQALFAKGHNRRISQLRIVFIFLTVVFTVIFLDLNRLYHGIRGQSIVKIYFLYNAVDLGDRLFAAVGQDIIENAFHLDLSKQNQKFSNHHYAKFDSAARYLILVVYLITHSFLLICQITSLNVAFNSHNNALFAVWLSNNFAEIKQAVFKKYDKVALKRITINDVRERIHFMISLICICMRNLAQHDWVLSTFFREILPFVVLLFFSELIVDYAKHIAIVRFNNLSPLLYTEYFENVVDNGSMDQKSDDPELQDYINRCCRLTGFSLLPNAVVVIRILISVVSCKTIKGIVKLIIVKVVILTMASITIELLLYFVLLLCGRTKHIDQEKDLKSNIDCSIKKEQ